MSGGDDGVESLMMMEDLVGVEMEVGGDGWESKCLEKTVLQSVTVRTLILTDLIQKTLFYQIKLSI